nr:MAG TPA: hypothetical protein [Caudoviricetes sp.]DAM96813.1 MAG TPA: hypothetical protein [Caudoviricetes sp.]
MPSPTSFNTCSVCWPRITAVRYSRTSWASAILAE